MQREETTLPLRAQGVWAHDLAGDGELTYNLCQSCFNKAVFMTYFKYYPLFAYQHTLERMADTYPTIKRAKDASAYKVWEVQANQWLKGLDAI